MKKLIFILFVMGIYQCYSQELITVSFSELNFEMNKDSTQIIMKHGDKYLNGSYKLITNPKNDEYSLCEFESGKMVGIQKTYRYGVITGTSEFKNGMLNGYKIVYDQTGENIMWKIHYVDGKKHGLTWWSDIGNEYYINDKKATKAEFEKYTSEKSQN